MSRITPPSARRPTPSLLESHPPTPVCDTPSCAAGSANFWLKLLTDPIAACPRLTPCPPRPSSFPNENWTLATEGYVEAAARGIFDQVDYLLAVQYFGENVTRAAHRENVFGTVNRTMALARQLRRSSGEAIPIIANTKPTYGAGPLVPPNAGWLEPATVRELVGRWALEPLVERVVFWYYPVDDLVKYRQPSLSDQREWWGTIDAWAACPAVPPLTAGPLIKPL